MNRRSLFLLASCALFSAAVVLPLRMRLGGAFVPALPGAARHVADDVDGDGAAEILLVDTSQPAQQWKIVQPRGNRELGFTLGSSAAVAVLADYDGDGRTDYGFYVPNFQPAAGVSTNWEIWLADPARRRAGQLPGVRRAPLRFSWGIGEHIAVPADYDGDGKADLAVFDPQTGYWHAAFMRDGAGPNLAKAGLGLAESGIVRQWGLPGDLPVPADYDGDKKADFAVVRKGAGLSWHLAYQRGETERIVFGAEDEIPMPADYDGDGKAELAVFRPGTGAEAGEWKIRLGGKEVRSVRWCRAGYAPVVRDYDGDGRGDLGCFKGENSPPWEIRLSSVSDDGRELFADKGPGEARRKEPVPGYHVPGEKW